ncbi:hypothetical protein RhiirA4_549797 [Rhizophagus irregularis]|uniref:Ion transport domain-containing protein n=1 Tax=Rhizophagus irregularis TaxID=588596 RepID=A0A2I1HFV3_9GLOM|nr:hypothetical protein RhiirA4_549797 [Rhizophagus irregularis]
MIVFSFIIVIYLMNLIIGLLGDEIKRNNDDALYYVQKAKIIAEIELFYLLPHQRRWRTWFPEVIYYSVSVEKARKYIREEIKEGKWKKDDWPEMKHKILKLLSMDDTIVNQADHNKYTKEGDITSYGFFNPPGHEDIDLIVSLGHIQDHNPKIPISSASASSTFASSSLLISSSKSELKSSINSVHQDLPRFLVHRSSNLTISSSLSSSSSECNSSLVFPLP